MFRHDKKLLHEVRVDKPNPHYGALLQEQLGGANGEIKAGMQYFTQSFRCQDKRIKDLMLDIASEEFGHAEMVATMITMLNGHDVNPQETAMTHQQQPHGNVEAAVLGGLGPSLTNASGSPFTGNFINSTGDLVADLLSDMAAEQRAKVVYEYLYRQIHDKGVRYTIDFLLNREEAHNALFREALEIVRDTGSNQDFGTTKDAQMYFDLSQPGRYFRNPNQNPQQINDH
ncbi:manganese catalase family protein [Metallumcola ferriviriculae]|uniref:Manganese catalase family protein n=1 Tax=Metallumcola ferriviriculae TaxID=3039180 RepID=A0AAU0UNG7_9FIRM|nr:manganese catalase family protein [Desulfitibacteraceae bacterium MK1]